MTGDLASTVGGDDDQEQIQWAAWEGRSPAVLEVGGIPRGRWQSGGLKPSHVRVEGEHVAVKEKDVAAGIPSTAATAEDYRSSHSRLSSVPPLLTLVEISISYAAVVQTWVAE